MYHTDQTDPALPAHAFPITIAFHTPGTDLQGMRMDTTVFANFCAAIEALGVESVHAMILTSLTFVGHDVTPDESQQLGGFCISPHVHQG